MTHQLFNPSRAILMTSGLIRPSWKVEFFLTTTTTPTPVYTTSALSTTHTQPVEADSGGVLPAIYLDPSITYKASYYDENDVLQYTDDPVNDNLLSQDAIAELLHPQTAAEQSAGVTPTNYAYAPGNVLRYGAVGDGVADDTAAVNAALSVGGVVTVPAGFVCLCSELLMSVPGTHLVIGGGARIDQATATNKLISVSAAGCTISGPGKLTSPATFDGTNAQRTYAVIWVTADDFHADRVVLDTIPRSGIHFEACTRGRVTNCRLIGNFPYASYTGSNTGHCAIDYDMPTSDYADKMGLVITGNYIESSVQGVLSGNFGDAAYETGVTISGNTFAHCWDHGIYTTNGEGTVVSGNMFTDCKAPIVVDGMAAVVVGNALYSAEPSQSNGNQILSVRDAQGAVIAGNTLYGKGAAILLDCISGTSITDNLVSGNTIIVTSAGLAETAIRVGASAETCTGNVVENNIIKGGFFGEFTGAIQMETDGSGFPGYGNVVRNNRITVSNKAYGINLLYMDEGVCEGNVIEFTHSAGGAATYIMLNVDTSDLNLVARNTFIWRTGGTNITARGINVGSGSTSNRVEQNRYRLSSGSLAGSDEVVDSGTNTETIATNGEVAANTATPSGATAYQLPVYDAGGTLLGYVPVYAAAWT